MDASEKFEFIINVIPVSQQTSKRERLKQWIIYVRKEFDFNRLIKELVFNGVISQSQYSTLQKNIRLRNAITHGFKTNYVDYNCVDKLIQLQQELLTELEND
ncbi:MAG: hypothetical protein AAGF83_05320 [Cyanobacteria bacterium P01_G01_bin.67]